MTEEVEPNGKNCTKILKKLGPKEWEIGKTKVCIMENIIRE